MEGYGGGTSVEGERRLLREEGDQLRGGVGDCNVGGDGYLRWRLVVPGGLDSIGVGGAVGDVNPASSNLFSHIFRTIVDPSLRGITISGGEALMLNSVW